MRMYYIILVIILMRLATDVFAQDVLISPQADEQSLMQALKETPLNSEKSSNHLNLILPKNIIIDITGKDASIEAIIKSRRPESDAEYINWQCGGAVMKGTRRQAPQANKSYSRPGNTLWPA